MDPKKFKNSNPRIKVIQKLYNSLMNPGTIIEYPKSQYKKFIKDVVTGTLEGGGWTTIDSGYKTI